MECQMQSMNCTVELVHWIFNQLQILKYFTNLAFVYVIFGKFECKLP